MTSKLFILASVTMLTATSLYAKELKRTNEKKLYVGANATEAKLTFNGLVQVDATTLASEDMDAAIESQVEHTIGPMSSAQFTAVPKGDHIISAAKAVKKAGTFFISYTYTGTIVLQNGPKTSYDVILANNPEKIYGAGFMGKTNPCTDHHYQSQGDFWYFWSPYNPGCKLKEGTGGSEYSIVKAKVERFTNTKLSYPEYQNLPDANGNVNIHVLFGMDDNAKGRNPLTSKDINAVNYRAFRDHLISKGYKAREWTPTEINKIVRDDHGEAAPFVETIQKGKLIYRFFFGPSAIDEDSTPFHWFYKDAIETSSVMLYGGHSGLGGHLYLPSIEENLGVKIKFNKKQYQIFFFDSCTSYKYYNADYFSRKISKTDPNGTKKLDVFTNGLSTYFHVMPDSNKALATALEFAQDGKFVSYQTLAKEIDSNNLFGISGDEDNIAPKAISELVP